MPLTPEQEAVAREGFLKSQGIGPGDPVHDTMAKQGLIKPGVGLVPPEPPPVKEAGYALTRESVKKTKAVQDRAADKLMAAGAHIFNTPMPTNNGTVTLGEAIQVPGKIQDWINDHTSNSLTRMAHFSELANGAGFGTFLGGLSRAQQVTFGVLAGEGLSAAARAFPEFTKADLGEGEDKPHDPEFVHAYAQIKNILKAGASGHFKEMGAMLDQEPVIYEKRDQLRFEDVFKRQIGEDKWAAWRAERGSASNLGLNAGLLAGDIFVDPNWLAGPTSSIPGKLRFAKNAITKEGISLAAAREGEAAYAAAKAKDARFSMRGDSLKKAMYAQNLATDQVKSAEAALAAAKDKGLETATLENRLARAQKRLAETNDYVAAHRRGPADPMIIPENPIRNPYAPVDDGKIMAQLKLSKIRPLAPEPGEDAIQAAVRAVNQRLGPQIENVENPVWYQRGLTQNLAGKGKSSMAATQRYLNAIAAKPGTGKLELMQDVRDSGAKRWIVHNANGKPAGVAEIDPDGTLRTFRVGTTEHAAVRQALQDAVEKAGFTEIGKMVPRREIKGLYKRGVNAAVTRGEKPTEDMVRSFEHQGWAIGGRKLTPKQQEGLPAFVREIQDKLTPDVYAALRHYGANLPVNPREEALKVLLPGKDIHVKDAAGKTLLKVEQGIDRVQPGYTRLYRGESGARINPSDPKDFAGRWFTDSEELARREYTKNTDRMSYVDVPTKDLKSYRYLQGDASEYVLPAEMAGGARKWDYLATPPEVVHMSPEDFGQLMMHGPSPAQGISDAAYRLSIGANPEDLTLHSHISQMHDWAGHGDDVPVDGRSDWYWTKRQPMDTPNPQDLIEASGGTVRPGFVKGSTFTNAWDRLTGGLKAGGFFVREPKRALAGSKAGEEINMTLKAAHEYRDQLMAAHYEELGKYLEDAKIGKRTGEGFEFTDHKQMVQLGDVLNTPRGNAEKMDEWYTRFKEKYDALPKNLQFAHDRMRGWLNTQARHLGISEDMFIDGYLSHVWKNRDPEMLGIRNLEGAGISPSPKVIMNALKERKFDTEGYTNDLGAILDAYVRGMTNKLALEPAYARSLKLAEASGDLHVQTYTNDLIREMKGQPGSLQMKVEEMWRNVHGETKPMSSAAKAALTYGSLSYVGLLAGKVDYLLKNMGTGLLNSMALYGPKSTMAGIMAHATQKGRAMSAAAGVDKQYVKILEAFDDAKLSPFLNNVQNVTEFANKYGGAGWTENWVRSVSFHAAMDDFLKTSGKSIAQLKEEGLLNAAIAEAFNASEEAQHVYGVMGRPPTPARIAGKAPVALGTQMLSFAPKQTEMLAAAAKDDPGVIIRYMMISGLMQRLAAQGLNVDTSNFTGMGYLKGTWPSPDNGLFPQSAAVSTAASMLLFGEYAAQAMAGTLKDPAKLEEAQRDAVRGIQTLIPFSSAIRNTLRAGSELSTGVRKDSRGNMVRPLDGKDLPNILTRLPDANYQDKRIKGFIDQAKTHAAHELALKQRYADKLVDAYMENDQAKMADLKEQMRRRHLPVSEDMLQARMQTLVYARMLRELKANRKVARLVPEDYRQELGSYADSLKAAVKPKQK